MKYIILFLLFLFLFADARAALDVTHYEYEDIHAGVYDASVNEIIETFCQLETIEANGQSPWCNKHRYTDSLEYCYCMKDDPEYSWTFPWEK